MKVSKTVCVNTLWKFLNGTTEEEFLKEYDLKRPVVKVFHEHNNDTDPDALLVKRGNKRVGYINADDKRWVMAALDNGSKSCTMEYVGEIMPTDEDSPQLKYRIEVDEDEVKQLSASEEWEGMFFSIPSINMVGEMDELDFAFDEIGLMLSGESANTEATMEDFMDDIAEYSRFDMSVETSQMISDLLLALEKDGSQRAQQLYDRLVLISSRRRSRRNLPDYAKWLDHLFEGERAEELLKCFKTDCIRKSSGGKVTREQLAQGLSQLNRELSDLPFYLHKDIDNPAQLMHKAFYRNISRDAQVELLSALTLKHQLEKVLGLEMEEKKEEVVEKTVTEDVEHVVTLEEKLSPIFLNNAEEVNLFVQYIDGKKPTAITARVNELLRERKVLKCGCKGEMWKILHEYGLYKPSKQNWNAQVNA